MEREKESISKKCLEISSYLENKLNHECKSKRAKNILDQLSVLKRISEESINNFRTKFSLFRKDIVNEYWKRYELYRDKMTKISCEQGDNVVNAAVTSVNNICHELYEYLKHTEVIDICKVNSLEKTFEYRRKRYEDLNSKIKKYISPLEYESIYEKYREELINEEFI